MEPMSEMFSTLLEMASSEAMKDLAKELRMRKNADTSPACAVLMGMHILCESKLLVLNTLDIIHK